MNIEHRKTKSHNIWTADHDAAMRRLTEAAREVDYADTPISQEELRFAVNAARDVGVGWTKIGDTLGIASGNAYQRYRKRQG